MKYSLFTTIVLVSFIAVVIISGCYSVGVNDILQLLKDDEFYNAVKFSFGSSLFATLLAMIFGIPTGLWLSRDKSRISFIVDTILDLPIVIPPLIVGILFLNFFNTGLVKYFFNFIFNFWGAVIAQFFVSVPYTVKASKAAFELVPDSYEMVALTMGKKPFKAFWDTTFNLALPGILSGVTLSWMRCVGEFGATLMVGGGIPDKTENIPINIYINVSSGEYGKALAGCIFTIFIALICIFAVKIIYFKLNYLGDKEKQITKSK